MNQSFKFLAVSKVDWIGREGLTKNMQTFCGKLQILEGGVGVGTPAVQDFCDVLRDAAQCSVAPFAAFVFHCATKPGDSLQGEFALNYGR
jgi:hypothetical protein